MSVRAKRSTFPGIQLSYKTVGIWIVIIGFICGIFVFVWQASVAFNGKADASTLQKLETRHVEDVYKLQLGIHDVRYEQRIILKAVAPKEAEELEKKDPLLPMPELK